MDAAARILDANANRAREALRTLEDLARFALSDAALSSDCKTARHDLASAIASLAISPATLLAARDTPGDVGTDITTTTEGARVGLAAVAAAAAGRASEALRVLEETAKALAGPWQRFESIRYRVYDLDRRLRTALLARAPQWTLCVLLTTDLCRHHPIERVAALAIDGGADCLQLREKTMEPGPLLALARRLVALARPRGVAVVVNDRPDIALLSGADGVHVGQTDLSVADCRRVLGPGAIVGVSTSRLAEARRAVADGASYCGLGPMFASTTNAKPTLAGPDYLRAYLADPACAAVPHLAISGIDAARAAELGSLGCRGVAVSSAVCAAEDPAAAARAIAAAARAHYPAA
jgi:thiamine-phosphate pyrophosphorylase